MNGDLPDSPDRNRITVHQFMNSTRTISSFQPTVRIFHLIIYSYVHAVQVLVPLARTRHQDDAPTRSGQHGNTQHRHRQPRTLARSIQWTRFNRDPTKSQPPPVTGQPTTPDPTGLCRCSPPARIASHAAAFEPDGPTRTRNNMPSYIKPEHERVETFVSSKLSLFSVFLNSSTSWPSTKNVTMFKKRLDRNFLIKKCTNICLEKKLDATNFKTVATVLRKKLINIFKK